MKNIITLITICLLISCGINTERINKEKSVVNNSEIESAETKSISSDKIKVLNFATFHMGETVDANKVEFDEENIENQNNAKKIVQMISKFDPTIICVEVPLEEQDELDTEFKKYLNSEKPSSYKGEVGLIAFEVGRMSKVDKIYGIDHEMEYNYNIVREIDNKIDGKTIQEFYSNPFKYFPDLNVDETKLTFFDRMRIGNTNGFLDFLILTNADLLTHVGSGEGFEGADEAAKFYKRNLRIYSNLNRIPATKDDRIFILTGGSHTAFLREFMKRSTKYEMVNTLDYLE